MWSPNGYQVGGNGERVNESLQSGSAGAGGLAERDDHGIATPDNPARWADLKAMGSSRLPSSAEAAIRRFRATGFPHAVIEEAMGHKVGGQVERPI
jgi:hypothetical protein